MEEKTLSLGFGDIAKVQKNYKKLLKVCDSLGTMVSQDREIEKDYSVAPYKLFRKGDREYIFPPQDAIPKKKKGRINLNPDYKNIIEVDEFKFNKSDVRARIKIQYNDANNWVTFKVKIEEVMGSLPKRVRKTIDSIFGE